jgi:hypothetical protein
VLETSEENGLRLGVLLTPDGKFSEETPVASIASFLPYSNFTPHTGALPPEVKKLVDSAPEPQRT